MVAQLRPERVSEENGKDGQVSPAVEHVDKAQRLSDAGMLQEALREDESARKLAPDDAYIQNNLGVTLARLGRLSEALETFESALRIQPNHPGFLRNKAIVLTELGRVSDAILALETVDHPITNSTRRALLDAHLKQLAKRGVISWSGGKPSGFKDRLELTDGPPLSEWIIQNRR